MNCNTCRELMADMLYAPPGADEQRRFEAHLAACTDCAGEYRELRATIALMEADKRARTAPAGPATDHLMDAMAGELDAVDRDRRRRWPARLAVVASLAAAVVLALLLPRGAAPAPTEPAAEVVARTALDARLATFLERTQPFLLTLANSEYAADTPLADTAKDAERAAAQRLAREAADLRANIAESASLSQRNLVDDIERLLMQVANLRDHEYLQGRELVRTTLENRTILFQISLLELRYSLT